MSICQLRQITHILYIKPFGLYSVCDQFARVYTSIKSTKIRFIPITVSILLSIKILSLLNKILSVKQMF